MKYSFKVKPTPEQVEALKRAIRRKRFGVFFQQRIGKTKVAIDFIGVHAFAKRATKTLVICPLSVMDVWVNEIEKHLPTYVTRKVILFPDKQSQRSRAIESALESEAQSVIVIINYDKVNTHRELLDEFGAEILIIDEAHLIKGHSSHRSKAVARIAKRTEYVLALTGTPVSKRWYDVFGIFRALDPTVFGENWYKFINKHGIKGGFMGKEIVGCVDYDVIADKIASASMRVIRKDVFDEPEVESILVPVTLGKTAMGLYKTLATQFLIELSGTNMTADMPGVRFMRLQQFCGGFAKDDDGNVHFVHNAKIATLLDLVNTHVEAGEKVVVFHRYREEGFLIAKSLRDKGYVVGEYNGLTSREERTDMIVDFQHDDMDVIVIQIATGTMGICLDRAHINIFYSMDFSLSNLLQAKDRIMGRGQKSDVTNYFLAVKHTVDYKIMKGLQNDEDIATMIQNKWRWMLAD